jgi:signal transduction histidine kinase
LKTKPSEDILDPTLNDALKQSGDLDACIAVVSPTRQLVAGQSRCAGFRPKGLSVWQAALPADSKNTWFIADQVGDYQVIVSRDLNDSRSDADNIFLVIIMGAIAATLGQFLLWRAINRIHQSRVNEIAETARRIAGGDLSARVPLQSRGDTYNMLSIALNDMAERFQTLAEATRIANNAAAHDLRMPLTRVLSSLQRMLDHREITPFLSIMVEQSQEEVERAMAQFSALNTLARLETGVALDTMEVVDISGIVNTACELFDPVLEDAQILLDVKTNPVQARVQVQLLTQAVANLLQNAAKYAGAGALVTVTCARQGDKTQIIVADNGPGIPDADLDRVVERYVRLDTSRSTEGFGLGLSMVSAVAKLHSGTLKLENANGLRCVITLPIYI